MTTVPGFSSRNTTSTVRQFPQRDEAAMTTPGFSNSAPDHESRVVTVDVVSVSTPAAPVTEATSSVATPTTPKKATKATGKSKARSK